MSKAITKYLERYAEKEAHTLTIPEHSFSQTIVIPAFDETTNFVENLRLLANPSVLAIVIVNRPDNSSLEATRNTFELLSDLKKLRLRNLLIINRVEKPLEAKQGVGLARKIGTDLALRLIQLQKISSPWIRQTDADASFQKNYYQTSMPKSGAVVYAHRHISSDPLISKAISLYDGHMSYYVNSLEAANSKYAYPTLGSTLAIHAETYAQVRGYPKRNAGEDFHLLNKIAKTNRVQYSTETTISLEARLSDRVPIGTGPSIKKILDIIEKDPGGQSYLSYNPLLFKFLAKTINELKSFTVAPCQFDKIIGSKLDELGFQRIASKLHSHYRSCDQRQGKLDQWFDALKTLRFLHKAEKHYPKESLLDTIRGLSPKERETIVSQNPTLSELLSSSERPP